MVSTRMTKTKEGLPDLSKTEYDILRILWKKGNQTVREVHNQLHPTYGWAYTTTKTLMDRMTSKGLLARGEFHGIYLYQPLVSRPAGLARLVQFFANRVLETDPETVVAMFVRSKALSLEEIKELERLLKEDG